MDSNSKYPNTPDDSYAPIGIMHAPPYVTVTLPGIRVVGDYKFMSQGGRPITEPFYSVCLMIPDGIKSIKEFESHSFGILEQMPEYKILRPHIELILVKRMLKELVTELEEFV